MIIWEIEYKGFVLTPMAAYDEGHYASMVIFKNVDQSLRASGVLGSFADACSARRFAIEYGMAEIDKRKLAVIA